MRKISVSSTLTVYHDGQFWVGICERAEGGRYEACRIVFGAAEPTDPEILAFVCERWAKLPFAFAPLSATGPDIASASGDPGASGDSGGSKGCGGSGVSGVCFAASLRHANPKRRQREARKLVEAVGAGTKAQRALAAAREARKGERKAAVRAARREEAARRFALRRQKRKRKHRGR
ncbi:hypothetical protein B5F40_13565 [Gordonibacter sp. An230]|uniref:YjdF family protein n=1 Tax=Gordonibacter sp. An230 TaxID=1965592 RepID=UPI000B38B853|nr:YjdF family protein [Gordonibacter sp. An230]OUO87559.1 hypothetical protein B5F40_13565 [Gordonibacter sp. An230]